MTDTRYRQAIIDAVYAEGKKMGQNGFVAMAEITQWCVDVINSVPPVNTENMDRTPPQNTPKGPSSGQNGAKDEHSVQKWHLCSKAEPEENTECWITTRTEAEVYRGLYTAHYEPCHHKGFICSHGFIWWNTALAWMPCIKPEPYRKEDHEDEMQGP